MKIDYLYNLLVASNDGLTRAIESYNNDQSNRSIVERIALLSEICGNLADDSNQKLEYYRIADQFYTYAHELAGGTGVNETRAIAVRLKIKKYGADQD